MPLSITPESKNTLEITNETKSQGYLWEGRNATWDEETGTWQAPDLSIAKEAKITLEITNETKS